MTNNGFSDFDVALNDEELNGKNSILNFFKKVFCCMRCRRNRIKPTESSALEKTTQQLGQQLGQHFVVTRLTEREVYNFEKIWKMVQKNLPEIGREMFIKLFTNRPDLAKSFDKFRGLEMEQLLESVVMEVHGMVVMNTIDEIVCHLDEGPEFIKEILEELGQSHARFGSQFRADDFWEIEGPFIEAIDHSLGGLKPNASRLVKKTIRFLISGIVKGYQNEIDRNIIVKNDPDVHLNDQMASFYSGSGKKLDLSEMIHKDLEEKSQLNHKQHHHGHHHHHHNHHHHHRRSSRDSRSIASISGAADEWILNSSASRNTSLSIEEKKKKKDSDSHSTRSSFKMLMSEHHGQLLGITDNPPK